MPPARSAGAKTDTRGPDISMESTASMACSSSDASLPISSVAGTCRPADGNESHADAPPEAIAGCPGSERHAKARHAVTASLLPARTIRPQHSSVEKRIPKNIPSSADSIPIRGHRIRKESIPHIANGTSAAVWNYSCFADETRACSQGTGRHRPPGSALKNRLRAARVGIAFTEAFTYHSKEFGPHFPNQQHRSP